MAAPTTTELQAQATQLEEQLVHRFRLEQDHTRVRRLELAIWWLSTLQHQLEQIALDEREQPR